MNAKHTMSVVLGVVCSIAVVFSAAATLGISSGLATNLYYVLQGISWAGLAVGIVAGLGISAAAAGAVWAAVKKMALKKFIQW